MEYRQEGLHSNCRFLRSLSRSQKTEANLESECSEDPEDDISQYGISEVLRSNSGPQFSSPEFTQFVQKYNFKHVTSSPHFSVSNGQAERAVKMVNKLLKDAEDPFLALLAYRATPLHYPGVEGH